MDHQKKMNSLLFEADTAVKEITALLKGDKEAEKIFKKGEVVDYLDYIYLKYEKPIEKIMKKYKLDYDTLAELLLK